MLVYFGVTPDANPKICVTPDASQWNIGGVGLSGVGAGVGHVHFMYVNFICVGHPTQTRFSVEYGLKCSCHMSIRPKKIHIALPQSKGPHKDSDAVLTLRPNSFKHIINLII